MRRHKSFLQRTRTILLGAAALAAFGAPAIAAPSGGSGGGSMPMPSGPRIDPQESYREGLAALEAQDYSTAEKRFGEVLRVAPDHPEANYYMALAKIGRDKLKSSVRYLKRAVKERETFFEAREKLALVSLELGDAEEAAAQLAAMRDLQANCATAPDECGSAYEQRLAEAIARVEGYMAPPATGDAPATSGEDEESGEEGEEDVSALPGGADFAGLFLQPREAGADLYRGAVRLINESRFEEAIAELHKSQAAAGPHPDILNYLGFANRKLGRMDVAQKYYAQALAIDPDHLGANEYLGELYLEIGEIGKAKRQLAVLDRVCAFGCAEREDLARLIAVADSVRSASKE